MALKAARCRTLPWEKCGSCSAFFSCRLYLQPDAFALDPDEVPGDPPRVKVRTNDRQARLDLLVSPDAHGMLTMFPDSVLSERTAAGMFAIPTSLDKGRLMLDAQPQDRLMPLDSRWLALHSSLPHVFA